MRLSPAAALCPLALVACLRETFPPADGGGLDDDGAPGDGAPPVDARIDGGASGHDEDGDGIDDAFDNCPHDANGMQRDMGEMLAGNQPDGVGDACDPDPAEEGNSILLFDGMYDGLVPGRWNASMATANGDAIRLESTGYLIANSVFPPHVLVTVSASLGNTSTMTNGLTVASNWATTSSYVGCRREIPTMRLLYGSNPSSGAPTFSPGQEIWMEVMTDASVVDCGTSINGGPWVPLQVPAGNLSVGSAMVTPNGTYALVEFMVVIGRP